MATTNALVRAKSLQDRTSLNTDIWYMVFTEIVKSNRLEFKGNEDTYAGPLKPWLLSLRVVSREFKDIVTPHAFSTLKYFDFARLDSILHDQNPRPWSIAVKHGLLQHTVTLKFALECKRANIEAMILILKNSRVLKEYCWEYKMIGYFILFKECSDDTFQRSLAAFQMCNAFISSHNHQESYRFEYNINWTGVSIDYDDSTTQPRKSKRLRELADGPEKESSLTAYRTVYNSDKSDSQVVSSPHNIDIVAGYNSEADLKILNALTVSITAFGQFSNRRRLPIESGCPLLHDNRQYPPTRKLTLESNQCKFSGDEMLSIWNWDITRVRSLTISVTDPEKFFSKFPIHQLRRLRTFKSICSAVGLNSFPLDRRYKDWITSLFQTCKELSSFKIEDFWGDIVDIRELEKIGNRLRKLRLITDVPQISEDPLGKLTTILKACPCIEDLEIDITVNDSSEVEQAQGILSLLAKARELRHLTLRLWNHTIWVGKVPRESRYNTDHAYNMATALMQKLHDKKLGCPFEKLTICFQNYLPDGKSRYRRFYFDEYDHALPPFPIRTFSSRKNIAGKCSHEGEYQQWGSSCHFGVIATQYLSDESPWTGSEGEESDDSREE
ncbi:hypothetical protein WAI453_012937 [Rhynchosporium graminicola]